MTVRQLPFEEWDRLEGLQIAANGLPNPDTSVIFVVEDAGEIVGTWEAVTPIVLEGLWVREDFQKTTACGRLYHAMVSFLKSLGVDRTYTLVQTPEVLELAQHGGFEIVPGDFLMLDLDKVQ